MTLNDQGGDMSKCEVCGSAWCVITDCGAPMPVVPDEEAEINEKYNAALAAERAKACEPFLELARQIHDLGDMDSSGIAEEIRDIAAAIKRPPVSRDEVIGNDGLTDAERHESAERWRNGAGRAPSKDEMNRLRAITPVTYKRAQVSAHVTDVDLEEAADIVTVMYGADLINYGEQVEAMEIIAQAIADAEARGYTRGYDDAQQEHMDQVNDNAFLGDAQ